MAVEETSAKTVRVSLSDKELSTVKSGVKESFEEASKAIENGDAVKVGGSFQNAILRGKDVPISPAPKENAPPAPKPVPAPKKDAKDGEVSIPKGEIPIKPEDLKKSAAKDLAREFVNLAGFSEKDAKKVARKLERAFGNDEEGVKKLRKLVDSIKNPKPKPSVSVAA